MECFQRSVSYDPTNVYSYAEMVEVYSELFVSDFISYKEFSAKIEPFWSAIAELNQSVDVVQVMFGRKMYFDCKFEEAEKHLQYALRLNPNCMIAHYRYIELLISVGRFSEALKELNQIMRIDPLSFRSYLIIGRAFYRMGQYENAMIYLNDALELEPNNYEALVLLGAVLTELGDYTEALSIIQKSLDIYYNIEVFSMLGYINALNGEREKVYEIIKQIQSQTKQNNEHLVILSRIYLALGKKEIAYEFLERAIERHDVDLIALKSDPRFAKIRNESRFNNLVKRIGIPA